MYVGGEITIRISSCAETPEEKIERSLKSSGLDKRDWEDILKERKER